MYSVLDEFTKLMSGRMQIIVSDHVNLRDEPWFQEAIVEEWRGGNALIPDSWDPRPTQN